MRPHSKSRAYRLAPALAVFACIALSFATIAYAQLATASINGVVRDATGAVLPGVDLVLRNTQTNIERHTVTNEQGIYVFLNVLPGEYELRASLAGFKTATQPPFRLAVNQTVTFDFVLEVGEITEQIVVEASAAEIQTSTSELGAVVSEKQVLDLPLNGRNFTQLLSLTPGVSPISVSQNAGGFGAPVTANTSFTFPSINGQNNRSNFYMLDGVNNQGAFTSTYAVPPIIDTIQEFKVQSHNDQAEFGGALGGIINVVTKSGTNEFHGSVWEFLRNDALDARNFFLGSKTPFRQNQFGATAGGPVRLPGYNGRDRTFFYFGYQGFRFRRAGELLFRVPTEANLRGDFSDDPRQIFNPFTTRPDPNNPGRFIRDPFPNNQIPPNLIHPGMLLFARTVLPKPIVTGVADRNALDTTPFKQNSNDWSVRIDHNLTSRDSLWFRWSLLELDQEGSGGYQAIRSVGERTGLNLGLSWAHTFSPSTLLQAQYGRTHVKYNDFSRFRNIPADFDQQVGFADTFSRNFAFPEGKLFPNISVANWFGGGESNTLNPDMSDIHQWRVNVSKTFHSHTLKWGGEIASSNFEAFYNNLSVGFTTPQTANPASPAGTGNEFASFLLNVPNNASRRNVHETVRWGGVVGFYFHDQWKATDRLTINVGIRYDRTFIPPYGEKDTVGENGGIETGSYDLNRGVYIVQWPTPSCEERKRAPCIPGGKLPEHVELSPRGKIYNDYTDNWQPRFGIAYRLTDKTVLRTGFGMVFDNWAGVTQLAQNYEGSWPDVAQQLANNMNLPSAQSPTPTHAGTNPFPEGLFPAPTPFNSVLWYMDPLHKNPYSMQWNFGIQHQLTRTTVITANYVGSGSRRLQLGGYYNVARTPGPGNPRERAPFPYIAPTFYDRSWGRSNYHSFQFLLDKKYSKGLAYMVSYTWSKAIDIGSSGWFGVEGHSVQDPYNFNNDRSVAGFDVPHLLSVNWVYELPVGPGKAFNPSNRVLSHIVGNWQFNGILLVRSGQPFNLFVPGDIANTGNVNYMRPDFIGTNIKEAALKNPTPERWFNTAVFAVPKPFTFGNFGRHVLRADGVVNWDLSVFRRFPIRESRGLEFRAEFFNAFNSPVFGIPVTNITSLNFGRVLGTAMPARQVQFSLKFIY